MKGKTMEQQFCFGLFGLVWFGLDWFDLVWFNLVWEPCLAA